MNGNPHTHEIDVRDGYRFRVKYGDTEIILVRWFGRTPSSRRISRGITRAIAKHDAGSLAAQARDDRIDSLVTQANSVLTEGTKRGRYGEEIPKPKDEWGSLLVNKK